MKKKRKKDLLSRKKKKKKRKDLLSQTWVSMPALSPGVANSSVGRCLHASTCKKTGETGESGESGEPDNCGDIT